MKILVITHSYPRWQNDWSANFIEALCLAYRKAGHEPIVYIPNTRGWKRTEEDLQGIRVIRYNYFPVRQWQVFGYGSAMSNDQKPSLGHIFLLPWLIISGIFHLSRLLKRGKIDFIQSHWAVPNSIIAVIGRKLSRTRIPVFTSFPGSDVTALSMLGKFGKFLTRNIIGKSDYLSCNSEDLRNVLVNLGLERNRIDLVIYAVDPEEVKFDQSARDRTRNALGIMDSEKMLLMVGRFVPKKGFSTALRALKEITDRYSGVKMILIGDGKMKQDYLEILENDNTARFVDFIGKVPLNDLYDYYSACDIFIMPTQRLPADGLNVAVVEAMACGRPVVATNIGGNEIVVADGINGYLFSEDDHHELAEKILTLLTNDDLAQELGRNSRKLVEEKFNWTAIAKHYTDTFGKYRSVKRV